MLKGYEGEKCQSNRVDSSQSQNMKGTKDETKQACEFCAFWTSVHSVHWCMENEGMQCLADNFFFFFFSASNSRQMSLEQM